jgi:hypothetical protein
VRVYSGERSILGFDASNEGTGLDITLTGWRRAARLLVRFQRPMRAEAGCPGTLKRLPVSVTSVPLTFRIEKS